MRMVINLAFDENEMLEVPYIKIDYRERQKDGITADSLTEVTF